MHRRLISMSAIVAFTFAAFPARAGPHVQSTTRQDHRIQDLVKKGLVEPSSAR